VNLAWWLAWTSNPVVVYRKVGWVGSIPMHLRQFKNATDFTDFKRVRKSEGFLSFEILCLFSVQEILFVP
jgi:hypothetical protein